MMFGERSEMKNVVFGIFLGLATVSCEETVDWQMKESDLPPLVVDGMITSEKKAHIVKLTRPVNILNSQALPVSDAAVAIHDGDSLLILNETPAGSGIYITDSTTRGVYGKIYTLFISHLDNIYTAAAGMIPITPPKPLLIEESGDEGFYQIRFRKSDEPAMLEYLVDWSHLSGYGTIPEDRKKARIIDFTLNSIDASEMFKPEKGKVEFPAGTVIIRKKYSLSEEHQEFIRTLLSETEWRGGVFDVLPGNVITNITGGAVGFFAACVVLSDTLTVFPQSISANHTQIMNTGK
ncbi:MAG: DUF4249 domain-containing protein [Bacteroidales bacterium]|nr:MAG: DUF4249 domain-containing protein [Bacteroidales bacterium]